MTCMRGSGSFLGPLLVVLSACGATSKTNPSGGGAAGDSANDGGSANAGATGGAADSSAGKDQGGAGGTGEAAGAGGTGTGTAGDGGSGEVLDPPDDSLPLDPVSVDGDSQPPNLACSAPSGEPLANALQLSGFVKTWRSDPDSLHPDCNCSTVSYVPIQAFASSDLGTPIAMTDSGAVNYTLSLPSGSPSLFHLLAQRFNHPTYTMNVRLDPTQPSAAFDLAIALRVADPGYESVPSLDDLLAAVEVRETEGRAVLIGRVVDCEGRPIEHARVTLSSAAKPTYYFALEPNNLPVLPSVRHETDADGEFFIPEIPTMPGPFVLRAWGFLTADDVTGGASTLQLISEMELPIPADAPVLSGTKPAIVLTDLFPTEGPL